jgi:hypothetical protein
MDLATAVTFARTRQQSVLTTLRRNGRPQLSNVLHSVAEDGIIRIPVWPPIRQTYKLRYVSCPYAWPDIQNIS